MRTGRQERAENVLSVPEFPGQASCSLECIGASRRLLRQCFANVRMRFTSCQRCVSDNCHPHPGMESCPFVIFQKSEPSVSASMSLLSVKFAGSGVQDAAIVPSPRPAIPWHIAQFPLKRLCACFKFCADGGTGFFTSLALCGASQLHATVPAHSRIANTTGTRPIVTNWKLLQTCPRSVRYRRKAGATRSLRCRHVCRRR
jgi:hypothetical protein